MLKRHWKRTGEMPSALSTMPKIPSHLLYVLDAFNLLTRFRPWRKGIPDPIGYADIVAYAEVIGIYGADAVNDFADLINECDNTYTEHHANRAKAEFDRIKNSKKR